MADRIGQQLGNYRIMRLLGSGGFAEVYLGEHIYLKSQAALKVLRTSLSEKDVQRFLAEAQTLVRLRHPHIVRVLEFAVEQGTPVLVMDYAPGGIIRETYPSGSLLPLNVVVAYIKQVASALQYAHNHNVIHRDVKPGNILLGPEQQLLLSDFGLSLFAPVPEQLSTQEMAGTIPYMAPEQLHGKPVFASDQYALGIVTYEWLCGTRPFTGTMWEIAHQHLSVAPPPLHEKCPSLPVEVEDVVLKALAKEPQQRFVSVQAFAHALARASNVSMLAERSQASTFVGDRSQASFATQPDQSLRTVFLAASPADESFVKRLKADLEARGMFVESPPTTSDQEEKVRQTIRTAQFVLVVISPHMRTSRTLTKYLRIASMYERSLIFVWAAGDDIATLLPEGWGKTGVIDLVDARECRYELALNELVACLEAEEELSLTSPLEPYFSEIRGRLPEPRNPYKGLRAFTQNDVTDFFGRDALIQELIETMQGMLMSGQVGKTVARLLTVIGPSGSGKSSVAMAGLLPRLSDGALPGSEEWVYLVPILPGQHPLEALTLSLSAHFTARSLTTIRQDLQDDATRGLHLLAASLVQKLDTNVVLMVDQFEEIFTQTTSEEERLRFIDLLVTAVTETRGPLIVILTLRADFYDRLAQYPELGRLIQKHHQMVFPMEIENLRAIIEQPAAISDVQLTFEGNLIGDLLFDTQGQVGALPLLEFTLDQLFQQRIGHQLTLEAYQKIGGVKGALAKHAEATYASLPSEEHRKLARSLFLRLIDPGIIEQDVILRRLALSELSLSTRKRQQ
jgi:serine/threonine protein kinase